MVQYLCEQGADKNLGKHNGATPLYIAVVKGHFQIVQYLCAQGVNWRATMVNGKSLAFLAIKNGHTAIADYLRSLPDVSFGLGHAGLFSPTDGAVSLGMHDAPLLGAGK